MENNNYFYDRRGIFFILQFMLEVFDLNNKTFKNASVSLIKFFFFKINKGLKEKK